GRKLRVATPAALCRPLRAAGSVSWSFGRLDMLFSKTGEQQGRGVDHFPQLPRRSAMPDKALVQILHAFRLFAILTEIGKVVGIPRYRSVLPRRVRENWMHDLLVVKTVKIDRYPFVSRVMHLFTSGEDLLYATV